MKSVYPGLFKTDTKAFYVEKIDGVFIEKAYSAKITFAEYAIDPDYVHIDKSVVLEEHDVSESMIKIFPTVTGKNLNSKFYDKPFWYVYMEMDENSDAEIAFGGMSILKQTKDNPDIYEALPASFRGTLKYLLVNNPIEISILIFGLVFILRVLFF